MIIIKADSKFFAHVEIPRIFKEVIFIALSFLILSFKILDLTSAF